MCFGYRSLLIKWKIWCQGGSDGGFTSMTECIFFQTDMVHSFFCKFTRENTNWRTRFWFDNFSGTWFADAQAVGEKTDCSSVESLWTSLNKQRSTFQKFWFVLSMEKLYTICHPKWHCLDLFWWVVTTAPTNWNWDVSRTGPWCQRNLSELVTKLPTGNADPGHVFKVVQGGVFEFKTQRSGDSP